MVYDYHYNNYDSVPPYFDIYMNYMREIHQRDGIYNLMGIPYNPNNCFEDRFKAIKRRLDEAQNHCHHFKKKLQQLDASVDAERPSSRKSASYKIKRPSIRYSHKVRPSESSDSLVRLKEHAQRKLDKVHFRKRNKRRKEKEEVRQTVEIEAETSKEILIDAEVESDVDCKENTLKTSFIVRLPDKNTSLTGKQTNELSKVIASALKDVLNSHFSSHSTQSKENRKKSHKKSVTKKKARNEVEYENAVCMKDVEDSPNCFKIRKMTKVADNTIDKIGDKDKTTYEKDKENRLKKLKLPKHITQICDPAVVEQLLDDIGDFDVVSNILENLIEVTQREINKIPVKSVTHSNKQLNVTELDKSSPIRSVREEETVQDSSFNRIFKSNEPNSPQKSSIQNYNCKVIQTNSPFLNRNSTSPTSFRQYSYQNNSSSNSFIKTTRQLTSQASSMSSNMMAPMGYKETNIDPSTDTLMRRSGYYSYCSKNSPPGLISQGKSERDSKDIKRVIDRNWYSKNVKEIFVNQISDESPSEAIVYHTIL